MSILGFFLGKIVQSHLELASKPLRLLDFAQDTSSSRLPLLREAALRRVILYENALKSQHLYHGMVVNLHLVEDGGSPVDGECDSLLFSSLRFVALNKLGFKEAAHEAWTALMSSQSNGRWFRHPKCRRRPTSRDMIVGLLAGLTQQPPEARQRLEDLLEYIEENDGYIGSGAFHVSKLSPGVGELIRNMALYAQIDESQMPNSVRYAFSTVEFDRLNLKKGFPSHLLGLRIWMELEMMKEGIIPRSASQGLDEVLGWQSTLASQQKRLRLAADALVRLDEKNLFFQWLALRVRGPLSDSDKAGLLTNLLSMKQFPATRLPQNCDRKADYLWQRDSVEYQPEAHHSFCYMQYAGVDFIWMIALVLDDD